MVTHPTPSVGAQGKQGLQRVPGATQPRQVSKLIENFGVVSRDPQPPSSFRALPTSSSLLPTSSPSPVTPGLHLTRGQKCHFSSEEIDRFFGSCVWVAVEGKEELEWKGSGI